MLIVSIQRLNLACLQTHLHHHGTKGGHNGPLCARMGLEAGQKRFQHAGRPVRLYLLTGAESPFCSECTFTPWSVALGHPSHFGGALT